MSTPNGWKKVKLGDVVNKINDKVPNRDEWTFDRYIGGEHFDEGEIRITRSAPIEGNEEVIGSAFSSRFKPGQVLYVTRNPRLRKGGMVDFEGVCSNVSFVMEADETKLLQSLLPFIIQTEDFVTHTCNNAHGSTNPFLNWKDIAKYEFLLPPIEEQKKISEVLWSIENNIKAIENNISKSTLFKNKLLNSSFTISTKCKHKLGDYAKIVKGVSYKSEDYCNPSDGNVFLNLKCVGRAGGFNKDGIKWFNGKYKPEHEVFSGEILIANTDLTRAALVVGYPMKVPKLETDKKMIISMDLTAIRNKDNLDANYLYYLLQSKQSHDYMLRNTAGSTVLHLSVPKVPHMKLEIPNLAEQKVIAKRFLKIDKYINYLEKDLHDLKNLRNKLSNELLSGRLRLA